MCDHDGGVLECKWAVEIAAVGLSRVGRAVAMFVADCADGRCVYGERQWVARRGCI